MHNLCLSPAFHLSGVFIHFISVESYVETFFLLLHCGEGEVIPNEAKLEQLPEKLSNNEIKTR